MNLLTSLLYRLNPSSFTLLKVSNKLWIRPAHSNKPWTETTIKPRGPVLKANTEPQVSQIHIPSLDGQKNLSYCAELALQELERRNKVKRDDLWWTVSPVKAPALWKFTWISTHKNNFSSQNKKS